MPVMIGNPMNQLRNKFEKKYGESPIGEYKDGVDTVWYFTRKYTLFIENECEIRDDILLNISGREKD